MHCTDIFEEDIANRSIDLLAPADGFETKTFAITFWWDTIQGANNYELQVVSPNFDNANYLLLDTLLSNSSFLTQLQPGLFQWRVRALNSTYATPYAFRSLRILNTDDLAEQIVILKAPSNNSVTKDINIHFSWEKISIADEYNLLVSGAVIIDTTITLNSINLTFEKQDALYNWFVIAKNSTSQKASQTYAFTIDATPPNPPTLTNPPSNSIFDERAETIEFSWGRNSNDILYDSLYLTYENAGDAVDDFPKQVEGTKFELQNNNSLINGNYFWRVKSVDKSLTPSVLSSQRSFTISKN